MVSNITFYPKEENIGDVLDIYAGPFPLATGTYQENRIFLPPQALEKLFVGVVLYTENDIESNIELGEIIEVATDHVVLNRNVSITSSNNSIPISMVVEFVKDLTILSTDKIKIGESLMGGVRIEKDLPVTIKYTNVKYNWEYNPVTKNLHYTTEFLY